MGEVWWACAVCATLSLSLYAEIVSGTAVSGGQKSPRAGGRTGLYSADAGGIPGADEDSRGVHHQRF